MIDTSGSIPNKFLCQAVTESVSIMKETGAKWIRIYFHDTECYHWEDYSKQTINNIKVTRAGTSHVEVFDKVKENEKDVALVIAFTDLETDFPAETPPYTVIWAHPEEKGDPKPITFGRKVMVKLGNE